VGKEGVVDVEKKSISPNASKAGVLNSKPYTTPLYRSWCAHHFSAFFLFFTIVSVSSALSSLLVIEV